MKKHTKNKRMTLSIVVLLLVVALGIGYAALTTALKINGHVALGEITFAIHFDNVATAQHKATVNTEAYIVDEDTKKEISFDISLAKLNDYYRFTTDIVNDGSIPGKIKSIEYRGLNESQKRLLNFRAYYTASNKTIAVGDFIGPETRKNITVELVYELSDDVTDEDLVAGAQELDCSFIIHFENGDMNEYLSRAASNRLMQQTDFFPTSLVNFTINTNPDEHEGVYRLDGTENDDFPIYFYRGSNTYIHNHLIFGGYCWRIIRTTSTGGIKIIYNGVPNEDGQCTTLSGNSTVLTNHVYGTSWNYSNGSLKTWLSTWYFENLIQHQAYLEDTPFCNNTTYYNGNVSLECDPENEVTVANGKNNYPIGFITAQEANLVGQVTLNGQTPAARASYGWLDTGVTFWTISATSANIYVCYMGMLDGYLDCDTSAYYSYGVRPVVSLNSEVVFSGGDGTTTNPYTVSLG